MRARSRKPWWTQPALYGVLLRLLLMPVGACWDLFSYYWMSHAWVYHGVIPLVDQISGVLRVWPTFYLHTGWLWLIKPLIGPGDPWGEGLMPSTSLTDFWVGPEAIHAFFLHPHIHGVLFLLKCPYLLAELFLIWLLLRYVARSEAMRRTMAWFLWLNPLSLYTIYLFGAWDVIPVGLMILSAILLRRRTLWAGLCFALAVTMKFFPLFVFPWFVLALRGNRRHQATFLLTALLPFVLWVAGGEWLGLGMVSAIVGLDRLSMPLSWEVPLRYHDRLYLFIIGYVLMVFHAARAGVGSLARLAGYGAAVLLLFYSLSFFHVQYVFWCVPFLAILIATRPQLLWVFVLQAVCLAVYTLQWERALTTYLVAPVNPDVLFHVLSPYERLAHSMNPDILIGIAHSVFAGASLWMIYEVLGKGPQGRGIR